ncbi:MAG: hypothetical protein WD712_01860 [Candidatus Spechtbacterales bacterium]
MELKWEITRGENFKSLVKSVFHPWTFLAVVVFGILGVLGWSLTEPDVSAEDGFRVVISYIMFVWIVLVVVFLFKSVFYNAKKYVLTDNYIQVQKGLWTKRYSWDEFKDFLIYESYATKGVPGMEQLAEKVRQKERSVFGPNIYLRKKKKFPFLRKTYLILYTETDSYQQVVEFIEQKLPQKKQQPYDFEGLVNILFK